jgi:hypothetical protein
MAFIFPTRTTSSTAQEHVNDHNLLASLLDRAGGFGLNSTRADHLAEHNAIHPAFSLPTRTNESAAIHLTDSTTLYTDVVKVYAGPRGATGPRASTSIPEWPVSFTTTINPGATAIQDAIAAGSINDKFRLTAGTYAITTQIIPKSGQEFWAENGVTITFASGMSYPFKNNAVPNVKVMNLTMLPASGGVATNTAVLGGTRDVVDAGHHWTVAYCDITGGLVNDLSLAVQYGNDWWCHHNYLHDTYDGPIGGMWARNVLVEDNMLGEPTGTPTTGHVAGNKVSEAKGITYRHNRCRTRRSQIWFDGWCDGVIEWNLLEDGFEAGVNSEINGLNGWGKDSSYTDTTPSPGIDIRYNYCRNNGWSGIWLQCSALNRVYYNVTENNGTSQPNPGFPVELYEYMETRTDNGNSGDDLDLKNNYFHHNFVTPLSTGRGAAIQVASSTDGSGAYLTNPAAPKNNVWDYNTYHLAALTGSRFSWNGTKTWAQWQAVPQDVNGEAFVP